MAYQQISSPRLVCKGIGLVVRALAVVCAIAELALADPALAGADLGTGIGAKALCAASQHPGVASSRSLGLTNGARALRARTGTRAR